MNKSDFFRHVTIDDYSATPKYQQLANAMSGYWVNFAKTGNPNGDGLPAWLAYNTSTSQVTILGEKPFSTTLPDKAALDFMVKDMTKQ